MRRTRLFGLGALTLFLLTACNLPPITIDLVSLLPSTVKSGAYSIADAVGSAVPLFTDKDNNGLPSSGDIFYDTTTYPTWPSSDFPNGLSYVLDLSTGLYLPDNQGTQISLGTVALPASPKRLEVSYEVDVGFSGTCLQSLGGILTAQLYMATTQADLWNSPLGQAQTVDLSQLNQGLKGTISLDTQSLLQALSTGGSLYVGLKLTTQQGSPLNATFDTQNSSCQTTVLYGQPSIEVWGVKVDGQISYAFRSLKLLVYFF